MPGPYGRPLSAVHHHNYMDYVVQPEFGSDPVVLEVYTGWVQCDIGFVAPTAHVTMKSFLPVNEGEVRFYPTKETEVEPENGAAPVFVPGAIKQTTVVTAIGGVAPTEDEANVFAVDGANVTLEEQTFGGIAGSPLCLVLNTRLGLLNCHLFNFTYQVQVITRGEPSPVVSAIPRDQRPLGGASPEGGPLG